MAEPKEPNRAPTHSQRLEALVRSSSDAIYSKDSDGRITSWNPGAERLYGYRQTEAIGSSISVLIPPDREGEEMDILRRVFSGERVESFETQRRAKDGAVIDVSITVSPILDDAGGVAEASIIARDIRSQKREEEALRAIRETQAANRAVQEFVAMAAHDLRTPLGIVTGMSSLLRQSLEDSVGARELEMLEMIERNGLQMSRLVSDLLLMSRAEIDALKPASEDFHITDFLKGVLDGLARDVELLAPAEDVVVTADPGHVQRILDNLVVNAKRYGAPPYRLSVVPREEAVEVRLADAGPGVPDELMGRLFTKFARGPGSTRAESTGLGLAISRSLARANGGDAWYEPNRPTGAIFCVRLRRTGSTMA